MLTRVKLTLVSSIALLALGATICSAASAFEAPFWKVAGKRLGAEESKPASIKNVAGKEAIIHGTIGKTKIEIRCEKMAFEKGGIKGSPTKSDARVFGFLELLGCTLWAALEGETFVQQTGCEVGAIKSKEELGAKLWLEGTVAAGGDKANVVFEKGVALIAEVSIKTIKTCGFSGTYNLEGTMAAQISPENQEVSVMKWIFPVTPIAVVHQVQTEKTEELKPELKFAGNSASIQGEVEVELNSKEKFAGGAFAPRFLVCEKVAEGTGKFKDSQCKEAGEKGSFEKVEETGKVKFTSTMGEVVVETKGGTKLKCTSGIDTGETVGGKAVGSVLLTFKGCESMGFKCNSKGAAPGEIKSNKIVGELGYLEKAGKKVGLDLKPAEGETLLELECGALVKVKIRGSLIGEITPVNTWTTEFTIKYEQAAGVQKWTKFEGGAKDVFEVSVNGGAFEEAGVAGTDKVTTEVNEEIEA